LILQEFLDGVSKKAPRVHHAARRRGSGMAAGGARAAAGDAGDRLNVS
jgi:hypothetical protein